jgi:hypothetical protein
LHENNSFFELGEGTMGQNTIYKYFHLNETDGRVLSISALENSYVYAASPSSFNDPFDCAVQADLDMTPESYECYCRFKKMPPAVIKKRLEYFFNMNGTLNDEGQAEQYFLASQLHQVNMNLGVCCFSGQPYNPLMWAHYAANHSGFCLEFKACDPFETKEFNDGSGLHIFRGVEYSSSNSLPKVKLGDFASDQNKAISLVTEKGYRWNYEEELRLIIAPKSDEDRFISYSPEMLTGIYYGKNINSDFKECLRNVISEKYTGALEFDMKISNEYYWMDKTKI